VPFSGTCPLIHRTRIILVKANANTKPNPDPNLNPNSIPNLNSTLRLNYSS